jgi:hypothetical protein
MVAVLLDCFDVVVAVVRSVCCCCCRHCCFIVVVLGVVVVDYLDWILMTTLSNRGHRF